MLPDKGRTSTSLFRFLELSKVLWTNLTTTTRRKSQTDTWSESWQLKANLVFVNGGIIPVSRENELHVELCHKIFENVEWGWKESLPQMRPTFWKPTRSPVCPTLRLDSRIFLSRPKRLPTIFSEKTFAFKGTRRVFFFFRATIIGSVIGSELIWHLTTSTRLHGTTRRLKVGDSERSFGGHDIPFEPALVVPPRKNVFFSTFLCFYGCHMNINLISFHLVA